MAKIDETSVAALRENLAALREMSPVGATRSQVRAGIGFLRDTKQNLVAAWRFSGLPSTPRIDANVLTITPRPRSAAVLFGAFQKGQSNSRFMPTVVNDENVRALESGLNYLFFGERAPDLAAGADPFERRSLTVSEFFGDIVFARSGVMVSRYDVVEYGAYRLGAIHSHASRYHVDHAPQLSALDALRAQPPFHTRDNVEYLLLSIVHDLCAAPDIGRFIDLHG